MERKQLHRFALLILCSVFIALFVACSDDENASPFSGSKAYLRTLSISTGEMSFDPSMLAYDVYLGNDNASVSISPTAVDTAAIVKVNNTVVTSGSAFNLALASGVGTASVSVEVAGKSASTYVLTFISRQSDSRLKSLVPSSGVYSLKFAPSRLTGYNIKTEQPTISLAATAVQPDATITINGLAANNGAPTILPAFSTNGAYSFNVVVTSKDGSHSTTYNLVANYAWPPTFTTTNYDFDGGIAAYIANLAGTSQAAPYKTSTSLTGVVTAIDVYMHSSGNKSFFIQDQNAGIVVFTSEPPAGISVGDKITITAANAYNYYEMPEITSFAFNTKLSSKNNLYYKTGDYAKPEAKGCVYMYDGAVTKAMDNFKVGYFTTTLAFHGDSDTDWSKYLEVGQTGKYYGPVNYSYSVYRLEICSGGQILPD